MPDLISEFERELAHTDNVGATFTRFVTTCYEKRAEAGRASAYIIKLFGTSNLELRTYVRILDVTKELRHGSKMLALHMAHHWDTARDDHKITRLAESLLCDVGDGLPIAPPTFLVDLAEVLATRRPDLALRLINRATNDADSPADESLIDRVLPRIEAGKFLQTQTEGVRHFWQNHLRCSTSANTLPTMTLRLGVEAVRGATLPDAVFQVFRSSLSNELWDGKIADLLPSPVEIAQVPVAESKPAPVVIAGVRMVKPPAARPKRWLKPAAAAAAVLLIGAVLKMRDRDPQPSGTIILATAEPKPTPKPASAPVIAASKPTPSVPKGPAVVAVAKTSIPAAKPPPPALTRQAPAKPQPVSPPQVAAAPAPKAPVSKPNIVASVAAPAASPPMNLATFKPAPNAPVAIAKPTPPPAAKPPAPAPAPTPKVAAAPAEVVARPLTITAFDRWLMQETATIAEAHPDLLAVQQTIVINPAWKDSAGLLEQLKAKDQDQTKTRALLRWLVIDPPVSEEARKAALLAWADLVTPEECLTLWVKLVDGGAVHSHQIRDAAWLVLVKQANAWSNAQREKLRDLAAINERD